MEPHCPLWPKPSGMRTVLSPGAWETAWCWPAVLPACTSANMAPQGPRGRAVQTHQACRLEILKQSCTGASPMDLSLLPLGMKFQTPCFSTVGLFLNFTVLAFYDLLSSPFPAAPNIVHCCWKLDPWLTASLAAFDRAAPAHLLGSSSSCPSLKLWILLTQGKTD